MTEHYSFPLCRLRPGDRGVVVAIEGGSHFQQRITSMGVNVGASIDVLHHDSLRGQGAVVVRCGETRLMLGEGMAEKITVKLRPADKPKRPRTT